MQAQVVLGNSTITVEAEDAEELNKALAEVGALAPALVDAINVVASASKATAAAASITKPAAVAAVEPGSEKKCKCGLVMNDVRGLSYKSGDKKGQPYPNDYYPTCKTKETGCKPE